MSYIPGETQTELQADTLQDIKSASISLAQQARMNINIFSQDLDANIYDNRNFEQAIFKLAKRHPNTLIRILVQNTRSAVQNSHCLIRLAQSLTSSVLIHNPSREYIGEQASFMIVDRMGSLYRADGANKNYQASINFNSPGRAIKLEKFFDEVWHRSTPDLQTRRIFV